MSHPLEESVTLHYTDGGRSNKLYVIRLEAVGSDQFTVTGFNGKLGGSLTPQKKTPTPVPYAEAKAIFNSLEEQKRNHPKTPYTVTDRKQGSGSAPPASAPAAPKTSNYQTTGFVAVHPKKITEDEANRLLHNNDYIAEQKLDGEFLSLRLNSDGQVTAANKRGTGILVPRNLTTAIRQLATISGCVSLGLAGEYLDSTLHVFTIWEKNGTSLLSLPHHLRIALKDKLASELTNTLLTSNSKTTFPIKFIFTAQTQQDKLDLYDRVKQNNGEGVVFKHRESDISFKFKLYETGEFLLKANEKRSAECFAYHDGVLISLGSATIPTDAVHAHIQEANLRDEPLVASVKYLYLSAPPATGPASGQLTQASFIRFRPEYQPSDCTTVDLKVVNKAVQEMQSTPTPPTTTPVAPPANPTPAVLISQTLEPATLNSPPATLFAL